MEAAAAVTRFRDQLLVLVIALVAAQTGRRKKRTTRKRASIYTKAERNMIIDAAIHPLAEQHWAFVALDSLLHATNEIGIDPKEILYKFLRYNAPELLKRILKELLDE
jgi:hypothetical protein